MPCAATVPPSKLPTCKNPCTPNMGERLPPEQTRHQGLAASMCSFRLSENPRCTGRATLTVRTTGGTRFPLLPATGFTAFTE